MKRFLPVFALLLTVTTGCSTTSSSNTARTASEQLLISNAIDQSLSKVSFDSFANKSVFLDDKYVECVDKKYLISSIRHRLLRSGANLAGKAEAADIVLEPRSGGVGTNTANSFVGTPEIVLPGMLTLPEIHLLERKNQTAIAKIGFVAYSPKSKSVLGDGGVSLSQSDDSNWFLLGVGPYQNGSVRSEVTRGIKARGTARNQPISQSVAFSTPQYSTQSPGRLQLASGKEKTPPVKPATSNTGNSPIWAK